jgi:PDZ domain-containing protein
MTRRGRAFLAAGVLLVALIVIGMSLHVPYVTFSPGPVTDTLGSVEGQPLIKVDGHQTYPAKGRLELTTVTESNRLDMITAVRDWFDKHNAVVPEEIVRPPGTSEQQVQQQNAQQMTDSQESATTAAMKQLGVAPVRTDVVVVDVPSGSPSTGKLQSGDVITSVDGQPVHTATDVSTAVRKHSKGDQVTIGYTRGGKPGTATITTESSGGHTVIGITTSERNVYPFTVTIQLKNVGGPSAGLMFALGIVEKLTPGDMTGGRVIAGTGTIDDSGNVGAIGGIQQKIQGARQSGATIFFVPAPNCSEAKGNAPSGIKLLRVNTLSDAMGDLQSLSAGKTNQPTC